MGGLEEHLPSYVEARKEELACGGLPLPKHLYVACVCACGGEYVGCTLYTSMSESVLISICVHPFLMGPKYSSTVLKQATIALEITLAV